MIEFSELGEMRDFLDEAPEADADAIAEWLVEAGMDEEDEEDEAARSGPHTVVVFGSDGEMSASVYLVPDSAIDAGMRAGFEAIDGRVFALEDIEGEEYAGALWLLAVLGLADEDDLEHFREEVPGVDGERLLAARGGWDRYFVGSVAPIRGAEVTHIYTTRLAQ